MRQAAPYTPTPDDIARQCESLQCKWSNKERRKRAGLSKEPPLTTPVIPPDVSQFIESNSIQEDD